VLLLAGLLALLIGLTLGLLGGGGSILTVPMLVYAVRLDAPASIATSLLVVGTTSLFGAAAHARRGAVRYGVGLLFGAAGMAGAVGGSRVSGALPSSALLIAFAALMLVTAVAMGRRREERAAAPRPLAAWRALLIGAAVGFVAGLVGAGGGFLVVPALALFSGLSMRESIGTSLLVIAMQSLAGFAAHAAALVVPWDLVLVVTAASTAGGLAGARLASRLDPARRRAGFAWLVLAVALWMLARELERPAVVLVVGPAAAGLLLWLSRSRGAPPPSAPCAGRRASTAVAGARL
jgi:uncharacterized membrane protein YfcA